MIATLPMYDRPETRALLGLMGSDSLGVELTRVAGTVPANLNLPLEVYDHPEMADIAAWIRRASQQERIRFSFTDVTGPRLWGPYDEAIITWFTAGPDALPGVLADLEEAWLALDG